jgi:hypothetical protein
VDIQSHIDSLNVSQKADAARQAEKIAGVLRGIQASTPDLNERLCIARHMAPAAGIDPARIAIDDISDQGIAGHIAKAMNLKARLEPEGVAHCAVGGASTVAAQLPDIALRREFVGQ